MIIDTTLSVTEKKIQEQLVVKKPELCHTFTSGCGGNVVTFNCSYTKDTPCINPKMTISTNADFSFFTWSYNELSKTKGFFDANI